MLETHTLRDHLNKVREELCLALYNQVSCSHALSFYDRDLSLYFTPAPAMFSMSDPDQRPGTSQMATMAHCCTPATAQCCSWMSQPASMQKTAAACKAAAARHWGSAWQPGGEVLYVIHYHF